KLLIDNIDRTFITPVFNGSASLRDAAGQLIESTTKSMRRKETVDDAYFTKLYKDTKSLYHLDSVSKANTDGGEKKDFGPLPSTSKFLLIALLLTWVAIGGVYAYGFIKKTYGKNNHK
ncbi:MAG: ABC transporter substrate-binding protein, partial [Lachnospiraceae bacterium]|nr:ABC transporter substrate-binding protein [Lachnospiraceae bacterium]